MKTLGNNWLTEGILDFEYKKYVLLDYFQNVKSDFDSKKLYPYLADLVFHYQNLLTVRDNKKLLSENFPEVLTDADLDNLTLAYTKIVSDDAIMQEIEDIIHFSIPHFKAYLSEGKGLYEYIESKLELTPVGLSPIHPDEGYLLVNETASPQTKIYEYKMSIFQQANEQYRGIHMHYLETQYRTLTNTIENIKISLIKRFVNRPNPATYLIQPHVYVPLDETLLPIAKRMLVKYITTSHK